MTASYVPPLRSMSFGGTGKVDGVVKSPIYSVAAIFQVLDIPYVLSRT